MSNEKQDLINHRLTATACKNYTDKEIKKAKDELKTFFSKNTVNTEDHTNELAYQITAPAGAKLLQLQSIGGNSVKYEPSVASDDTTALVKTMPSVVYDFDVNKVKGVSEVSENLFVLQDIAETTDNGLTFSVSDGVLTINGTAISNFNFGITLSQKIQVGTYSSLINISGTTTATGNWVLSYSRYEGNLFNLGKTDGNTVTSTTTQEASVLRFYVGSGIVFTNYKIKVMLVKGSTPPTEFKVGYEGIHNNELTGFKVEGANLWDIGRLNITKNAGVSGTIGTLEAGTYTISWASIGNISAYLNIKVGTAVIKNINMNTTITTGKIDSNSFNFTLSETSVVSYLVDDYYSITTTTYAENVMLNRGSTAIAYVPYITPTTVPIDLTSIVDTSGNKLFADGSLKGINDVYDEITPYKAVKRFGIVDLGILNWGYEGESSTKKRFYASNITNIKANNVVTLLSSLYTPSNSIYSNYDVDYADMICGTGADGTLFIRNTSYTDAQTFKTAMSGVYLVYELATPIEADINLSQLKSIQGHSNGSITALNTYDMAVPSEIRYNSIIQDTLCPSITITRNGVEVETRNLPTITSDGYGVNANAHNLRVFSDYEGNETKERHIIVGKVDLGSLNYERTQWGQNYVFQAVLNDMIKTSTNNVNLLCPNYSTVSESYLYNNVVDKVISNNASGNMNLKIVDNIYTDVATFKRAMSGVYLYYELATEDISQLDSFDYFFDVEEGDTITFNNPYAQQVYATYSFITKEVKPNE